MELTEIKSDFKNTKQKYDILLKKFDYNKEDK